MFFLKVLSHNQTKLLSYSSKCIFYKSHNRSSCHGSAETNLTSNHEDTGLIPGLLSGVRIRHCPGVWCSSQTWLESGVAVAVVYAGGYSSDSTPSVGTSICHRYGPKKRQETQTNKQKTPAIALIFSRP